MESTNTTSGSLKARAPSKTPLELAIRDGRVGVAEELLVNGAIPRFTSSTNKKSTLDKPFEPSRCCAISVSTWSQFESCADSSTFATVNAVHGKAWCTHPKGMADIIIILVDAGADLKGPFEQLPLLFTAKKDIHGRQEEDTLSSSSHVMHALL